jgi:hypothetical protein
MSCVRIPVPLASPFPVIENRTPHSWEIDCAVVCCFDTPYDREYTFREIYKKNAYDFTVRKQERLARGK